MALALGIKARRRADRAGNPDHRTATRAIRWAIVQTIVVILCMLSAGPDASLERAHRIKCASNLRQIGQASALYANDHNGQLPDSLASLLSQVEMDPAIFICPSSRQSAAAGQTTQAVCVDFANPGHCSYIYVAAGPTQSALTADHILAYESPSNHNNDGANVLYGDSRVEWASSREMQYILSELAAGHNPPRSPSTLPTTQNASPN